MPLLGGPGQKDIVEHFQQIPKEAGPGVRAVLVVSAHWEEETPTVISAERPKLLYDYFGFPDEAYAPHMTYPCPGAPWLAERVKELLGKDCALTEKRGLDHGVFVPMKVAYPAAEVPITQVSLLASLDPQEHLRMGKKLAPLRDEGVLIVGSGFSFHNMQLFGMAKNPKVADATKAFDDELNFACTEADPGAERSQLLTSWEKWPFARACHPREEHLIPLMVCAGAAEGEQGTKIFGRSKGLRYSAFRFGQTAVSASL